METLISFIFWCAVAFIGYEYSDVLFNSNAPFIGILVIIAFFGLKKLWKLFIGD